MGLREPNTQTLELSDVEDRCSHLVDEVSRNELRVIVAEAGTPIAAVISVADLERWARLDREREERFAVLDRMRAPFADVPPEELEREVAKAIAEVRAEMAAEREKSAGAR
jgi:prevent-host-death family protein